MLRAMDSAVAGLRAHQNKMDVVGHNIANVNTYGFKAQTYTFKEAMYQTSTASTGNNGTAGGVNAAQYGYGTLMGTIGMDMTASTPTYVGGFNASIDGDGFFITLNVADKVTTADFISTNFDYTRVGQLTVDSAGYIVDGNGNYVYGFVPGKADADAPDGTTAIAPDLIQSGKEFALKDLLPLRAPTCAKDTEPSDDLDNLIFDNVPADGSTNVAQKLSNIQVDKNGKISAAIETEGGSAKTIYLGSLAIATFQNPNGLTKVGNNYYNAASADNTGEAAASVCGGTTPTLMPGYIEASNTDLAKEFSDMITTHRGFQANSKMITVSDEMLSDLVAMKR